MNNTTTYQVIEDNAGNIIMYVWKNDNIVFYGEINPKDVLACIADVENADAWDVNRYDLIDWAAYNGIETDDIHEIMQASYEHMTSYEYGYAVIADENGTYPERTGYAGSIALAL